MTSINTNISAMAALQTLRTLSGALEKTQEQVSSGLRVATASDNAAYWSISTTMRSDRMAVSAVSDALGLGAAKVDVAYSGMSAVIDVLSEFKAKIVAATEDGIDKTKIQTELEQLKAQVIGISKTASFSGQNWLDTDIADIRDDQQNRISMASSFVRGNDGNVAVRSMDVDLSKIALFNRTGYGLLQADAPTTITPPTDSTSNPINYFVQGVFKFTAPITLSPSDSISFDLVVHPGGSAPDITLPTTITQSDVNAALGISTGTIADADEMSTVLNHVWYGNSAHVGVGTSGQIQPDGSTIWYTFNISANNLPSDQPDSNIKMENLVSTLPGGASGGLGSAPSSTWRGSTGGGSTGGTPGSDAVLRMNFLDIDVTNGVGDQLDAIEEMLSRTTSAAATLGSLKMRIDTQADFAQTMMATIDKGVGRLADADMNEASTRLKAIQTQQQLAVQSLQIANSQPEAILRLFS